MRKIAFSFLWLFALAATHVRGNEIRIDALTNQITVTDSTAGITLATGTKPAPVTFSLPYGTTFNRQSFFNVLDSIGGPVRYQLIVNEIAGDPFDHFTFLSDPAMFLTGTPTQAPIVANGTFQNIAPGPFSGGGALNTFLVRIPTASTLPILPPSTPAPNAIFLYPLYPVIPGKPTVVITHGWQPYTGPLGDTPLSCEGTPPVWVREMASRIHNLGANVVTPVWCDAFTTTLPASALNTAAAQVANQGRLLAGELAVIARNSASIQFIGHSLGTLVNAYAANILTQVGIHIDQFTILDRPFGQGIRPKSITNPIPFDADGPIFRTLLPKESVTWVDNYYGTDETNFPPATGAGLLPASAFNYPYDGANHSGVHDRYYATIPTTAPSTVSCPVAGGFLCSVVGGGFTKRQPYDWDPRLLTNPLNGPGRPLSINPVDWLASNCEIAFNVATCKEHSPAYLWLPQFHVSPEALFLSFEFQWTDTGDGDWLTLHFGDQLLFSFSGAAFSGSDFISGLIPIGQFAGQTNQLLFALRNMGAPNASFKIRNIRLTTFIPVAIDVKPGDITNSINTRSSGDIPVAILSTATFNAPVRIAPTSLTFGRTGNEPSLSFCNQAEDVNGDHLPDLVCHFNATKTGFKTSDTAGILKGRTLDGIPVSGTDSLRIVQ